MGKAESEKVFTRSFALVLLIYVFSIIASQMETNVFPVYLTDNGYSVSQAGVFTSIQNWLLCISPLAIAPFMTKSRHPDLFLFMGSLIHLTGAAAYLFLSVFGSGMEDNTRYIIILIIRVIQGIGYSMYIVAGLTMVTEFVSARVMLLRLAMYYNGGSIAAAAGPALGLWIARHFSYNAAFAAVIFFFMLTLFFCASLMIFENNHTIGQTVPKIMDNIAAEGAAKDAEHVDLKDRIFRFIELKALRSSGMFFVYEFVIGFVFGFIVLFSKDLGIAATGIFLVVYHLCAIIIRTLMDSILYRFGRGRSMIFALSCMTLGTALVFAAHGTAGIVMGAIFIGLGDGINYTLMNMSVIESVPEERRPSANGTFLSVKGMGIALGNIIGGSIGNALGLRSIYGFAALMFLILLIGFTAYYLAGWQKVRAALRR